MHNVLQLATQHLCSCRSLHVHVVKILLYYFLGRVGGLDGTTETREGAVEHFFLFYLPHSA